MAKLEVPPYSEDAEKAVLGSILIDKESIIKIYDLIKSDDFYFDKHQLVWNIILELYNSHSPIDILTISNKLEEQKKLQDI